MRPPINNTTSRPADRRTEGSLHRDGSANREEHAGWRKADTIADLNAAIVAANRGHWTQCRERTQSALKSAKQWEAAADTWTKWPNAEVSIFKREGKVVVQ